MISSSNTELQSNQELVCSICLSEYELPMTGSEECIPLQLDCSHQLCKVCKYQLVNNAKEKGDTTFKCPQCRKEISVNSQDLVAAQIIQALACQVPSVSNSQSSQSAIKFDFSQKPTKITNQPLSDLSNNLVNNQNDQIGFDALSNNQHLDSRRSDSQMSFVNSFTQNMQAQCDQSLISDDNCYNHPNVSSNQTFKKQTWQEMTKKKQRKRIVNTVQQNYLQDLTICKRSGHIKSYYCTSCQDILCAQCMNSQQQIEQPLSAQENLCPVCKSYVSLLEPVDLNRIKSVSTNFLDFVNGKLKEDQIVGNQMQIQQSASMTNFQTSVEQSQEKLQFVKAQKESFDTNAFETFLQNLVNQGSIKFQVRENEQQIIDLLNEQRLNLSRYQNQYKLLQGFCTKNSELTTDHFIYPNEIIDDQVRNSTKEEDLLHENSFKQQLFTQIDEDLQFSFESQSSYQKHILSCNREYLKAASTSYTNQQFDFAYDQIVYKNNLLLIPTLKYDDPYEFLQKSSIEIEPQQCRTKFFQITDPHGLYQGNLNMQKTIYRSVSTQLETILILELVINSQVIKELQQPAEQIHFEGSCPYYADAEQAHEHTYLRLTVVCGNQIILCNNNPFQDLVKTDRFSTAVYDDQLFVVGGYWQGIGEFDQILCYPLMLLDEKEFQECNLLQIKQADMVQGRCQPAINADDRYLIVAGGTEQPRPLNSKLIQALEAGMLIEGQERHDFKLVQSVEIFDSQNLTPLRLIDMEINSQQFTFQSKLTISTICNSDQQDNNQGYHVLIWHSSQNQLTNCHNQTKSNNLQVIRTVIPQSPQQFYQYDNVLTYSNLLQLTPSTSKMIGFPVLYQQCQDANQIEQQNSQGQHYSYNFYAQMIYTTLADIQIKGELSASHFNQGNLLELSEVQNSIQAFLNVNQHFQIAEIQPGEDLKAKVILEENRNYNLK